MRTGAQAALLLVSASPGCAARRPLACKQPASNSSEERGSALQEEGRRGRTDAAGGAAPQHVQRGADLHQSPTYAL